MTTKKHPDITLQPINSSQIHAIGHHPETNTLAIQFKSKSGTGSIYHYQNFTPAMFAEFQKAESIGLHFKNSIKNEKDKHPFTKIG